MFEVQRIKNRFSWRKKDKLKEYDSLNLGWSYKKEIRRLIKKMFEIESTYELTEIYNKINKIIEREESYLRSIDKYYKLTRLISSVKYLAEEMLKEMSKMLNEKKSKKTIRNSNYNPATKDTHTDNYGYTGLTSSSTRDYFVEQDKILNLEKIASYTVEELLESLKKELELSHDELEKVYEKIRKNILDLEYSPNSDNKVIYSLYELLKEYEKQYIKLEKEKGHLMDETQDEYSPLKLQNLIEEKISEDEDFSKQPELSKLFFHGKSVKEILNWIKKHDFSGKIEAKEEIIRNATTAIYEEAIKQGLVPTDDLQKQANLYSICSELLEFPEVALWFSSFGNSNVVEKILDYLEKIDKLQGTDKNSKNGNNSVKTEKIGKEESNQNGVNIGFDANKDYTSNSNISITDINYMNDSIKNGLQKYLRILFIHISNKNPNFSEYESIILNRFPMELAPRNECGFYQEKSMKDFVQLKIELQNYNPTIQDVYSSFYNLQKIFVDYLVNGYNPVLEQTLGKKINMYSLLSEFSKMKTRYMQRYNNMTIEEQIIELNSLSYVDGDSPVNVMEKLGGENLMKSIYSITLTTFKNNYINSDTKDFESHQIKLNHICTGMLITDIVDLYHDMYKKLNEKNDKQKLINLQKIFINVIKQQIIARDICDLSYSDDVTEEICKDFLNQEFMGDVKQNNTRYGLLDKVLLFEFKIKQKIFVNQSSYGDLYGQALKDDKTMGECYGLKN